MIILIANRRCIAMHTRSAVNSAGSNDPLKGGKGSLWDGGYRVPGFIGSGLIPDTMRGKQLDGVIHICDWWPTLASLAGLPVADATGPTPTDGAETPLSALLPGFVAFVPSLSWKIIVVFGITIHKDKPVSAPVSVVLLHHRHRHGDRPVRY